MIPIKDNGGYLEIAPVVRTDWKVRCAELERKNDALLRYAAACCRRQHEAEMRMAESEEHTEAALARAEIGANYWRERFERAAFERSRLRVLMAATAVLCAIAGATLILGGGGVQ